MKIALFQDSNGVLSLHDRPDTRRIEAELAPGYALGETAAGSPIILKPGEGELSAQEALECGLLQVPLLIRR